MQREQGEQSTQRGCAGWFRVFVMEGTCEGPLVDDGEGGECQVVESDCEGV